MSTSTAITAAGCGASHQTGWTALAGFMLEHVGGRDETDELGPGMES